MTSISTLSSPSDLAMSTTMDAIRGIGPEIHSNKNYQALPVDELLQQCAENPAGHAWREFIQRFDRLIAGIVGRTCREWPGTSP
ncbi:MAG TPA: hypothetical protein VG759_28245, partial [Candidatus Angelobacter sp.]|nr:hypothetical protein [Candidatus Angelobacter sp.]